MKKSNRDLCIEMWSIMADLGCDKSEALTKMGLLEVGYPESGCFACEECQSNCDNCPVTWTEDTTGREDTFCYAGDSPYHFWIDSQSVKRMKERASDVLHTITTTWKEEEE